MDRGIGKIDSNHPLPGPLTLFLLLFPPILVRSTAYLERKHGMRMPFHKKTKIKGNKRKETHCLSVPKWFQHRRGSSVCGLPFAFCWETWWHLWEGKPEKPLLIRRTFIPVIDWVRVPIKVEHPLLVRVSYKTRIWLRVTFWLTLTINTMRQCVLETNPPHTLDLRAGVFETFLFCCG